MPSDKTQQQRACDRCYTLKERCRWIEAFKSCERCRRLKQQCSTNRPVARVGRRPTKKHALPEEGHNLSPSESSGSSVTDPSDVETIQSALELQARTSVTSAKSLPQMLSLLGPLGPLERHVLNVGLNPLRSLGRYLVGLSFHDPQQQALIARLYSATPILESAFSCAAVPFAKDSDMQLPGLTLGFYYKKASIAVGNLRQLTISGSPDLSVCLALAITIIVFNLNVPGGDPEPVTRCVLQEVSRLPDPQRDLDPDSLSFAVALMIDELYFCLIWRRLPTFRYHEGPGHGIDRYIGLCSSLLPHLYDICELSQAMYHADESDILDVIQGLEKLEHLIHTWQPRIPSNFLEKYTQDDTVRMLSQTRIFRSTALLIIHRLRYPYGTEDGKAVLLSHMIRREFELVQSLTGRGVGQSEFSFIVACIEVTDDDERRSVLEQMNSIMGFQAPLHTRLQKLLVACWKVRDEEMNVCWFNFGDLLPAFTEM